MRALCASVVPWLLLAVPVHAQGNGGRPGSQPRIPTIQSVTIDRSAGAMTIEGVNFDPDPAVLLVGIAGGALGVAAAGTLATRRVLETAPLKVLRALG